MLFWTTRHHGIATATTATSLFGALWP